MATNQEDVLTAKVIPIILATFAMTSWAATFYMCVIRVMIAECRKRRGELVVTIKVPSEDQLDDHTTLKMALSEGIKLGQQMERKEYVDALGVPINRLRPVDGSYLSNRWATPAFTVPRQQSPMPREPLCPYSLHGAGPFARKERTKGRHCKKRHFNNDRACHHYKPSGSPPISLATFSRQHSCPAAGRGDYDGTSEEAAASHTKAGSDTLPRTKVYEDLFCASPSPQRPSTPIAHSHHDGPGEGSAMG